MKVGAEPKKVAILAALTMLAGYFIYNNLVSEAGPGQPERPASSRVAPTPAPVRRETRSSPRPEIRASAASRRILQEFRPSLKPRKETEQGDLSTIDPTLRLDLLARLQKVTFEGGDRSLFEFGSAPLPKKPEAKIIPKTPAEVAKEMAEKKPAEPVKPPPPPIPLRFYGYTTPSQAGAKRAFFLDGDDILVASEGQVMKKRYKVVRIGINSVVVEDMEHKHEQTLPLVAEIG